MTLSNFINELKHKSMLIHIEIINIETEQQDQYIGTVGEFQTSTFKEDYRDEKIHTMRFKRNILDKEYLYIFCWQ